MVVVVRGRVPAGEFALYDAMQAVDGVELEVERIIKSGSESVMPLVWARNVDAERFGDALAADDTVTEAALLAEFDDALLYRMEWIERVHLLLQMITDSKATLMEAYGEGNYWHLRMVYPDRDQFSRTHEFCDQHGLTFEVQSIRELEGEPAGRYGLTDSQYDALVDAVKAGYYAVPREVTLEELADQSGVSHQALSERLRRGTEALVEDTLLVGVEPEGDGDGDED